MVGNICAHKLSRKGPALAAVSARSEPFRVPWGPDPGSLMDSWPVISSSHICAHEKVFLPS